MSTLHPNQKQEASITAQATFTDPAVFGGSFGLRVRGTWSATVTLQRSDDGGTTYDDVESWTANVVRIVDEPLRGGATYRLGVKSGDFTSGTVQVRLG